MVKNYILKSVMKNATTAKSRSGCYYSHCAVLLGSSSTFPGRGKTVTLGVDGMVDCNAPNFIVSFVWLFLLPVDFPAATKSLNFLSFSFSLHILCYMLFDKI